MNVPLAASLTLLLTGTQAARVPAPERSHDDLRASLAVPPHVVHGEPVPLQLGLCNTGAQRLLIDKWAGYWFVRVEDSQRATVVPTRSMTTFRTGTPKGETLSPGLCWKTELSDLYLVTGVPGSTPEWSYERLQPGLYWLQAVFECPYVGTDTPAWTGKVSTGRVPLVVK